MTAALLPLLPVVTMPRHARSNAQYLMSVDLRHDVAADAWPSASEEISLTCLLETLPLFSHEPLGEATLLVHRFGGSYGPIRFLLTACPEALSGSVGLTFVDERGVLVHQLRVEVDVSHERDAGAKALIPASSERRSPRARLPARGNHRPRPAQVKPSAPAKPAAKPVEEPSKPQEAKSTATPSKPPTPKPESVATRSGSPMHFTFKKPPPPPRPKTPPQTAAPPAVESESLFSTPSDEWYAGIDDVPVGPLGFTELMQKSLAGSIGAKTLVWRDPWEDWRPLDRVPELAAVLYPLHSYSDRNEHTGIYDLAALKAAMPRTGASSPPPAPEPEPEPKRSIEPLSIEPKPGLPTYHLVRAEVKGTEVHVGCPGCGARYLIQLDRLAGRAKTIAIKCKRCGLMLKLQNPASGMPVQDSPPGATNRSAAAKRAASNYLDAGTPAAVQSALRQLQICVEEDPEDPETLEMVGRAFSRGGYLEKALQTYEVLAELAQTRGQPALHSEIQVRIRNIRIRLGRG